MKVGKENEKHTPEWHVYIVRCRNDTLYTGITTDLARRIAEHNGYRGTRGARYTRAHRPVNLVYSELADGRAQALRREREIKRLSKVRKLELIRAQRAEQVE